MSDVRLPSTVRASHPLRPFLATVKCNTHLSTVAQYAQLAAAISVLQSNRLPKECVNATHVYNINKRSERRGAVRIGTVYLTKYTNHCQCHPLQNICLVTH